LAPIQNSNSWSLPVTYPLLVGIYQRIEHTMARRQIAYLKLTQEFAHRWHPVEYFCQRIVIGRTGRCLSIVLGQAQSTAIGHKKRIHTRGRAGSTEAGIIMDQRLLPIKQAKLGAEIFICYSSIIDFLKSMQQYPHP